MTVYKELEISRAYWDDLTKLSADLTAYSAAPFYELRVAEDVNPDSEVEHAEALASILKDTIDEFVEETRERNGMAEKVAG